MGFGMTGSSPQLGASSIRSNSTSNSTLRNREAAVKTPSHSQASVCVVNPQEDWLAQSVNHTLPTTNLLLVCPRVADVLVRTDPPVAFSQQLRNYLGFHLRQRFDSGSVFLEWIFFLKDHDMLFGHSQASLRKFLATAPEQVSVLSFGHGRRDDALGLFAVRIDEWSLGLLDATAQILDERPRALTEAEALTIALALVSTSSSSKQEPRKVAYVPQWWLDVRSSCIEDATWESQFGIDHVVTPDKLCSASDHCQEAVPDRGKAMVDSNSQHPLVARGSSSPIESSIEDFWECVKRLDDVVDRAAPVLQLADAVAFEQKAAGTCRD
ncbi:hypothetical protein PV08_11438 [Exophiala spinifera]|uniref:Uncharacterized protein n=1 Tax=Exophiala spinifera TaxID=91928 RepID=A0A0D2BGN0_9EURO|nr:uncharacterized protein PV08_11438 [Exophiala spinifera]KIW10474.1 hypothetical protein PV08_11438 [Exophiala spinifera]